MLVVAGGILLAVQLRRQAGGSQRPRQRDTSEQSNPAADEGLERLDRLKRSQLSQEDAYVQSIRKFVSEEKDDPLSADVADTDGSDMSAGDSAPKERYIKTVLAWVSAGSEAQ